jgi:Zn-dependent M28 family amino/carboxypeptidase
MAADLNMDMFLPLYPLHRVTVYGLKESDLGDTIRKVAGSLDIQVQDDPAPQRNVFVRSDQYSFIRAGVPSLMMDDGFEKGSKEEAIEKEWLKTRYHAPSDDLNQPVDLQAAGQYDRLMLKLAETVADAPSRPAWKPDSFFRRFAQ